MIHRPTRSMAHRAPREPTYWTRSRQTFALTTAVISGGNILVPSANVSGNLDSEVTALRTKLSLSFLWVPALLTSALPFIDIGVVPTEVGLAANPTPLLTAAFDQRADWLYLDSLYVGQNGIEEPTVGQVSTNLQIDIKSKRKLDQDSQLSVFFQSTFAGTMTCIMKSSVLWQRTLRR